MVFASFLNMANMTNQTVQQQLQVVVTQSGIDPSLAYFLPSLALIVVYAVMWYLVQKHEDIGLGFFLWAEAGLMLGDPFLNSVKLQSGGLTLTLAFVLFTATLYHVLMVWSQQGSAPPEKEP